MKNYLLYIMAVFYIGAGVNHFIHPGFYLAIMPPWLPNPMLLVEISGVCEILFALLLFPLATRKAGAWLLILLLIAVFPANVQMAIIFWRRHDAYLWAAIVRLPLQILFIWWAWLYTASGNKVNR